MIKNACILSFSLQAFGRMAINGICSGCEFFFPLPLFPAVILQLFGMMQPCCFLVTCKSRRSQFGKPSPKTLLLWRFNEQHFKKAFVGVGTLKTISHLEEISHLKKELIPIYPPVLKKFGKNPKLPPLEPLVLSWKLVFFRGLKINGSEQFFDFDVLCMYMLSHIGNCTSTKFSNKLKFKIT